MTSLLVAVGGAVLVLLAGAFVAFATVTAFHIIVTRQDRGEDA